MGDSLSGKDEIRYEYLDASNNVRHHGNLRFAQLTLFSALTGGLMAVVFGRQPPLPVLILSALKGFGCLISVCFFVMERRTGIYWYHYQKRAAELEPSLGYAQYSTLPFGKVITAANATRVLYIVAFLMWLVAFATNLPEGPIPRRLIPDQIGATIIPILWRTLPAVRPFGRGAGSLP
jgi:hypothetical protein